MLRRRFSWAVFAAFAVIAAPSVATACIGDCEDDGFVTANELVIGVSLALGSQPSQACHAYSHRIDVSELTLAIRNALEGCPSYLELERLAAARSLWQQQGIDDYRMRYVRSCFCMGPWQVDIVVRDGVVESITDVATGEPVEPVTDGIWGYLAVDPLFAAIEAALADADEATIAYDAERGFPTSASFDFLRGAVDDELSVSITSLEPLD